MCFHLFFQPVMHGMTFFVIATSVDLVDQTPVSLAKNKYLQIQLCTRLVNNHP